MELLLKATVYPLAITFSATSEAPALGSHYLRSTGFTRHYISEIYPCRIK